MFTKVPRSADELSADDLVEETMKDAMKVGINVRIYFFHWLYVVIYNILFLFLKDVHNAARLFEQLCRYITQLGEWKNKLAAVEEMAKEKLAMAKETVRKEVERTVATLKGLRERVNPLHREVE